jgi:hypothetical protein
VTDLVSGKSEDESARGDENEHDELVLQKVGKHPAVDTDASSSKELLAELARKLVDLELQRGNGRS